MNLDEIKKTVGRLCVFGFDGITLPDWVRVLLKDWDLAGVILFKRNIESKEQLAELNREIRSVRKDRPVLISVDHEGGRVFRLPAPFTSIPTAREIGRQFLEDQRTASTNSSSSSSTSPKPSLPFRIGSLMGHELKEVGFNLNFAPVLDVDTHPTNPIIGDRAFSRDPSVVSEVALQMIEGLRSESVIPCGKHFPGHGDTSLDSHLDLPVVDQPLKRLQSIEFVPFQAAIQANIEMLMTAHVVYPALDPEHPATLSKKIITDVLRIQMDYNGVIISDDFNMKAIADRYPLGQAALRFWEAGGDLALVCRYQEICKSILDEGLKKLKDDKNFQAMLRPSLDRVECLMKKLT